MEEMLMVQCLLHDPWDLDLDLQHPEEPPSPNGSHQGWV